jgi:hypothetical protein
MDYKKLKAERYRANLELIETLKAIVSSDHGEQRFGQILRNYGFVNQENPITNSDYYSYWSDEFNLEPKLLLDRVKTECTKVFG